MHPSIEQYLEFLHTKRRAPSTLKVVRHDLTHFVVWGAQLPDVQRTLGHSRLSTIGVYLTPSEEEVRAALGCAGI